MFKVYSLWFIDDNRASHSLSPIEVINYKL
jgi:hypothetical protein